jgi:hypothetical protein
MSGKNINAAQVAEYSGGAQGECAVPGARAQLHWRQAVAAEHAHSVHGVISEFWAQGKCRAM